MFDEQTDEQHDDFKQQLESLGPYQRQVSMAMLVLAYAVETVLNLRDMSALREMKSVASDIFEQAEKALEHNACNLQ